MNQKNKFLEELNRLDQEVTKKEMHRRNILFLEAATSNLYLNMTHQEVIQFMEDYVKYLKELPL
jgi:oligoribonuclease (3'-5' exoribonuclease)